LSARASPPLTDVESSLICTMALRTVAASSLRRVTRTGSSKIPQHLAVSAGKGGRCSRNPAERELRRLGREAESGAQHLRPRDGGRGDERRAVLVRGEGIKTHKQRTTADLRHESRVS